MQKAAGKHKWLVSFDNNESDSKQTYGSMELLVIRHADDVVEKPKPTKYSTRRQNSCPEATTNKDNTIMPPLSESNDEVSSNSTADEETNDSNHETHDEQPCDKPNDNMDEEDSDDQSKDSRTRNLRKSLSGVYVTTADNEESDSWDDDIFPMQMMLRLQIWKKKKM